MNRPPWTGSDVAHLAIVATPLLILAGMFGASAVTWQTERIKLERVARQIVGTDRPIDQSTIIRAYDSKTSRARTETWKGILAASESMGAKYGMVLWNKESEDYLQNVPPPGGQWPIAEVMQRYAEEAEPVLAQIETLLDSEETIWLPIVMEAWSTMLVEMQQSRSVARLMHYCFLSAIHEGQTDRALQIVRGFDRLFGSKYEPTFLVDELVRIACYNHVQKDLRQSIALGVWSDEQLREIETILSKPFDWDTRWRKLVKSELLATSPITYTGDIGLTALPGPTPFPPIRLAPSSLRSMADRHQALASIRGAGSRSHIDEVTDRNQDWSSQDGRGAIDRWLQMPLMNSDWLEHNFLPAYGAVAATFARQANDHRFTRTILAVRQFRVSQDRWPASLEELSRVGLPRSEARALRGGTFAYEITDEDRAILFNTADKNATEVLNGVKPESVTMMP